MDRKPAEDDYSKRKYKMKGKHNGKAAEHSHMSAEHYRRLLLMMALSFLSMYVLMFVMVNAFANVHLSLNQFYMAVLL